MISVRVTFQNGDIKFLSESYPYNENYFILNNKITTAQEYTCIEEFMIAWRLISGDIFLEQGVGYYDAWNKRVDEHRRSKIARLDAIDVITMEVKEIDLSWKYEVDDTLHLSRKFFDIVKQRSMITSSQWLYSGDEWIGFPETEDMGRITKVAFYTRFITYIFSTTFLYRHHSIPSCYRGNEKFKKLMSHPDIMKIVLSNKDSCHRFTALPVDL
jgi:hypothetical protein